ncbi:MAG: helix-turn-helix domain-containing protein [Bdellovibrionales bacterium]
MEFEYGKKLENARTEKGLTLEDVSYELKINLKTLRRLEGSKTEELPKAPFTRGFIKTYCVHLGLEPSVVIEEYEKTLDEPTDKLQKGVLREDDDGDAFFAFDFFKNQFLPIAVLMVTILGAAVMYSLLNGQKLDGEVAAVKTGETSPVVAEEKREEPVIEKKVEQEISSVEKKPVEASAKFTRVATRYEGRDEKPKDVKKNTKVVKAAEAAPLTKPKPVVFKNTLTVEPLSDTKLYIQTNLDNKPVRATLKPDNKRVFKFDNAKIRFVDAGAVNLILNGKDIGALGVFGEEKTIEFPSMKEL